MDVYYYLLIIVYFIIHSYTIRILTIYIYDELPGYQIENNWRFYLLVITVHHSFHIYKRVEYR